MLAWREYGVFMIQYMGEFRGKGSRVGVAN